MLKKIKYILLSDKLWKKIIAYGLLALILYFFRSFGFIFLLTFLFSYMFFSLAKFLANLIKKYIKSNKKIFQFLTSINFIATLLYLMFIATFIYFISSLIPLLVKELSQLGNHLPLVSKYIQTILSSLQQVQHTQQIVSNDINKLMNEKNIEIISNIINHLKHFWGEIMKGIIAFILSYFFLIDREKLKKYLEWIKQSSLSFLYEEYAFLFKKIAKWFLIIFKAQTKIAIANTFLTWLWLHIISFIIGQSIPYLGLLTAIVFIFSFIPVLWVIISSIPIALIIYNLAGFIGVIYVIIMILVIHTFEAYVLNPRFVSEEIELPVSLTLLILLIWENLFWPIGLLISVPLFYICIEIFKEFDKWINSNLKWL